MKTVKNDKSHSLLRPYSPAVRVISIPYNKKAEIYLVIITSNHKNLAMIQFNIALQGAVPRNLKRPHLEKVQHRRNFLTINDSCVRRHERNVCFSFSFLAVTRGYEERILSPCAPIDKRVDHSILMIHVFNKGSFQ